MGYILSFSPFDISKNFAFGVGVGVGLGVVVRKLYEEKHKQKEHLISCLKQLAAEVRQLRETLIQAVSNNLSNSSNQYLENGEDSSDDEFFDAEKLTDENDEVEFIERIDKLQEGTSAEQQDAYNLLILKAQQNPGNADILWRFARSQLQIANLKEAGGDTEAQKLLLRKGMESGKSAINADENCFQAHKWYAMLLGSNIKFLETKEKILAGFEYKSHIEKALKLKSDDATCHYLLGRYYFEVFMLPWYMRKAAKALFAEPPTATADDALQCFLKAENLRPGFWAENPLYIGKCFYQLSNYKDAKEWFNKAIEASTASKDNANTKKEAIAMLRKC